MSASAAPSDAPPFEPGHVLAGRYRLVLHLGTGRAGVLWRADDLVLQAPVALRLVGTPTPDAREHLLQQIRLARRLTHPAICRVFDVGETPDGIYYSLELVHGEDLGRLLPRAGRLPPAKVVEIGHQLCEGLAAAHAEGVLHLNLKPSTVMLDGEGAVRITGFGFAPGPGAQSHDTDTGHGVYRAPECQAPGGVAVSVRSDIYAVGALLYELLVGMPPAGGAGAPPRPSALVPDVPPQLERIVLRALHRDPARRPVSAAAMAAHLVLAAPAPTRHRLRPWLAGAALAVAVGALSAAAAWLLPSPQPPLVERDTVLLADVVNTTGDRVFDRALKVALAVALEQSPYLRIFPDERARETLRLMQRAPDEPLTTVLAREVARRERLKATVGLSIGMLGSRYVLSLEAVDAERGDVLAREQAESASKDGVLAALGAASARLRSRLGESIASVERFDAPLPQATTVSLEALHAFAMALDGGRAIPRAEAIPHLQRAIDLDPDFAMAYAQLSSVYANTWRSSEAPGYSRRAFELRDRVSERERFFISWRYYLDAVQAMDQALELALSWTATYRGEAMAFNSLGIASAAFGDHDQAIRALREAIALDARFAPAYGNLAGSLIATDRLSEAQAVLADAAARQISFPNLRRMGYLLAFILDDEAAMARELRLIRDSPNAAWAPILQARSSVFGGRIAAAHKYFQQGIDLARRDNFVELAAQWASEDAEAHAVAGDCDPAAKEAHAALALNRDNFTLERAARALALCGRHDEVARLTAELTRRFPGATLTMRVQLPVIRAAGALERGDAARALDELDEVAPFDHAVSAESWPAYLRGLAYLRLKNSRAAAGQFQSIVRRRGEAGASPLYALAQLGAARAAALSTDVEAARRAYEAFFVAWRGADPTLPVLGEASTERARLQ